MVARILALLAAVGLVAGAFAVRGMIDGDSGASGDGGLAAVWCDPLVGDACAAALPDSDVQAVEPGTALERLAGGETPPTVWVTAGNWPEVLAASGGGEDAPDFGDAVAVAATPLAVAATGDNLALLDAHCGDEVTWDCLAEAAGQDATELGGSASLRDFRLGHVTPPTSSGLATLEALAGTIPEGDEAPTRDDVTSQPYARLLDRIEPGDVFTGSTENAIDQFLTRPGEASVFVGPEAALAPKAGARGAELRPVSPTVDLVAQVAPLAGSDAPDDGAVDDFANRLGSQLTEAGWNDPSGATAGSPGLEAAILEALADR
ncbi:MAG: substrate-binding domain-containing protein [Microthrixaceae bacterium]